MKTLIIILLLSAISVNTFASGVKTRMRPQDQFIIETFTDIWQNVPGEIKSGSLDRGVSISFLYDYPIKLSYFSVAAGVNYTSHNYYTKNHLYTRVGDTDVFDFIKPDGLKLDNAKISLNYIAVPVEFRYFVRSLPKTLRLHAGFKTGFLINGYNKYSGKQEYGNNTYDVSVREYELGNIEPIMYGVTARIGYGRLNVFGFMPLNNIFSGNDVEDMFPISVGLALILF